MPRTRAQVILDQEKVKPNMPAFDYLRRLQAQQAGMCGNKCVDGRPPHRNAIIKELADARPNTPLYIEVHIINRAR